MKSGLFCVGVLHPPRYFLPQAGPVFLHRLCHWGNVVFHFRGPELRKMIENYPVAGELFVYTYVGFGPKLAFV